MQTPAHNLGRDAWIAAAAQTLLTIVDTMRADDARTSAESMHRYWPTLEPAHAARLYMTPSVQFPPVGLSVVELS